MITKRALVPIILCAITGFGGFFARPAIDPMPTAPMPEAAQPKAAAVQTDGIVRVSKIEVLDPATGKLMLILTSENGVPIIIVNDKGTARKVDIAWLARRFG